MNEERVKVFRSHRKRQRFVKTVPQCGCGIACMLRYSGARGVGNCARVRNQRLYFGISVAQSVT